MPEATGSINRSNTICHYTRFFRFLESNCNGSNVGDPKMVELLHLFAENGLTSNRRYACTIKIQRPFRLPSLRTHRPTRHPIHHHGRPNFRLPHLRRRADDRPVCVTKSPTNPATPSRKGTYPPKRNTLNSRILRHNSPSPGRLPRFADASPPHHSRLTSLIP